MFYSHEILTNTQHGVATVWLVATVGKSGPRKLNRKTIQGVNVPKACDKIIHPGAPLALRLQGNLLYGVSRVFSHQCNYVLSDAESVQAQMLSYFRAAVSHSEADPQAGKAQRHHITLQDDPDFDPMSAALPRLDLLALDWSKDPIFGGGQAISSSTQGLSQLTPVRSSQPSSGSRSARSNFSINLPDDDVMASGGSYRLPSDLVGPSPSWAAGGKQTYGRDDDPFSDNEALGGLGLEIDGDGNLIGMLGENDQPELPILPQGGGSSDSWRDQLPDPTHRQRHDSLTDGVLVMGEEAPLPDAEAFPAMPPLGSSPPALVAPGDGSSSSSDESTTVRAPQRRMRTRRANALLDRQLHIRRDELRSWSDNYVANMMALADRHETARRASAAAAKRNAEQLILCNGIASIGLTSGDHPLVTMFSGKALQARLFGITEEAPASVRRSRRRTRDEAFDAVQD